MAHSLAHVVHFLVPTLVCLMEGGERKLKKMKERRGERKKRGRRKNREREREREEKSERKNCRKRERLVWYGFDSQHNF